MTVGGPNGSPSPNTGQVSTVAAPTAGEFLASSSGLGMDIGGTNNTLYVTHDDPNDPTKMGLYTRDLTTGAETFIGFYPAGTFINDISIALTPVPEPAGVLLAAAAAGLAVRRWRGRAAA